MHEAYGRHIYYTDDGQLHLYDEQLSDCGYTRKLVNISAFIQECLRVFPKYGSSILSVGTDLRFLMLTHVHNNGHQVRFNHLVFKLFSKLKYDLINIFLIILTEEDRYISEEIVNKFRLASVNM